VGLFFLVFFMGCLVEVGGKKGEAEWGYCGHRNWPEEGPHRMKYESVWEGGGKGCTRYRPRLSKDGVENAGASAFETVQQGVRNPENIWGGGKTKNGGKGGGGMRKKE